MAAPLWNQGNKGVKTIRFNHSHTAFDEHDAPQPLLVKEGGQTGGPLVGKGIRIGSSIGKGRVAPDAAEIVANTNARTIFANGAIFSSVAYLSKSAGRAPPTRPGYVYLISSC